MKWLPAWEPVSEAKTIRMCEESVKICYQETTSEEREDFVCCSYNDIWSVNSVSQLQLLAAMIR